MTPIILHHGLFGTGSFRGIDRAIADAGHPVFVSTVHPTAGIERRARQLQQWILSIVPQFAGERAVLIAHSMGGLDARYLLSHLGMAEHVETLVTISTPHRGSPYADWCAQHIGRKLRGFEVVRRFGLDVDGVLDVTTDRCARFNEESPDVPGVRYFSVSASCPWRSCPPSASPRGLSSSALTATTTGWSPSTARWATHLTTWRSDHWRQINQRYGLAAIKAGDISPEYLALIHSIRSI